MSTATERTDDFFTRLMLSDDQLGYPHRVAVVAADLDNVAAIVRRNVTDGTPIVVVQADGDEMLVAPVQRFKRIVDRIRRRRRVRVEIRRGGDAAVCERSCREWGALERELLPG